MANEVLLKVGTQISFADHTSGDFNPSAANDLQQGTPTEVELELASVGDDAARESDQVDLGEKRARSYSVMAAIEWSTAPDTGEAVEFYWAASPDSTAANGNPGYVTGSEGAYSGGVATLDEGLDQLEFIGVLKCSADATTQIQHIGTFTPPERYGTLVVVNRSGQSFDTDDIQSHVVFNPIVDEIQ